MGKVILDAATLAKLNGLSQQLEVYDEQGNLRGHVMPVRAADAGPAGRADWGPFTAEEVEAAFKQSGPGRTLDEIIRDAGLS